MDSWVVISGVISRVTILMTHIRGLITPLMTTHEPPSREQLKDFHHQNFIGRGPVAGLLKTTADLFVMSCQHVRMSTEVSA